MVASPGALDLSILPREYRAVFEAQQARTAEPGEANKRLEHLVCEVRHAAHGKRSETLT
ncbi:MAG: hypothetical protein AAF526_00075 [Pseudomonadota bacterium]